MIYIISIFMFIPFFIVFFIRYRKIKSEKTIIDLNNQRNMELEKFFMLNDEHEQNANNKILKEDYNLLSEESKFELNSWLRENEKYGFMSYVRVNNTQQPILIEKNWDNQCDDVDTEMIKNIIKTKFNNYESISFVHIDYFYEYELTKIN